MIREVFVLGLLALGVAGCAAGPAGRKVRQAEMSCRLVGEVTECVGPEGRLTQLVPGPTLPDVRGLKSKKDAYQKGYEEGQRLTEDMRREYHESARHIWRRALIQKVCLPGGVDDGIYREPHCEYVVHTPASVEHVEEKMDPDPPTLEEERKLE